MVCAECARTFAFMGGEYETEVPSTCCLPWEHNGRSLPGIVCRTCAAVSAHDTVSVRLHAKRMGGHYHVDIWSGKDRDHRGKNGTLAFTPAEFARVANALQCAQDPKLDVELTGDPIWSSHEDT